MYILRIYTNINISIQNVILRIYKLIGKGPSKKKKAGKWTEQAIHSEKKPNGK